MGRLKDEVFFQTLNDYFNHYLPVQRCASIHTIKAYRSAIHKLLEYILKKKNKNLLLLPTSLITAKPTLKKKGKPLNRSNGKNTKLRGVKKAFLIGFLSKNITTFVSKKR